MHDTLVFSMEWHAGPLTTNFLLRLMSILPVTLALRDITIAASVVLDAVQISSFLDSNFNSSYSLNIFIRKKSQQH
jgi:hypothetical protein